ncbi:MAG: sugar ABC transporter ATP-binding protein [Spirochaetales bacterium]|nr:sugar ABC transporter ATP-binding protein [Spirochaetales bacterium]
MDQTVPLLQIKEITKSFASNVVLKGVDISLSAGEVVVIVGGNGAGKSTLMKILMGIYRADQGEVLINGEKVVLSTPSHALHQGIYLVPQEPMLFPNMSVEENIIIGIDEKKAELRKRLRSIIKKMGWNVSLSRKAETLSIAEQQLVEILRGLMRQARILIFDEPTSALTFKEIDLFFKIIEDLKAQNIGMFYITHRLKEVFEIATNVVVLKDGRITSSGHVSDFTEELLIKGLLSDEDEKLKKESRQEEKLPAERLSTADNPVVLEIKDFCGYGFNNINLQVKKNEVLGLAGVVGSGRTELAETVFGLSKSTSGYVYLNGENITDLKTSEVIGRGINYLPEDRHLNGIFGMGSVKNNITASILKSESGFLINDNKETEKAKQCIRDFRIKVTDENQKLSSLSGGNQQKVVIGKVLASEPQLIILDEPTRGIDAEARSDVYRIIEKLKEAGNAILLISSDYEEVLILSDRIEVMHNGTNIQSFENSGLTMDRLTEASFGVIDEVKEKAAEEE